MAEVLRQEVTTAKNGKISTEVFFICDACGKEASRPKSKFTGTRVHFCDRKCYGKHVSKTNTGRKAATTVNNPSRHQIRWHDIDIKPYAWALKYNTMKLR